MTLTVLHLTHQGELETLANAQTLTGKLRRLVRQPSLGWSVERLEALHDNAEEREAYFATLRKQQETVAFCLYERQQYVPVAQVASTSLQDAYALTNSHGGPWTETTDPRLTVLTDNLHRKGDRFIASSTDVGDLVRDNETGEYHLCLADGFASLGFLDRAKAA